jgi:hypothetical protein
VHGRGSNGDCSKLGPQTDEVCFSLKPGLQRLIITPENGTGQSE